MKLTEVKDYEIEAIGEQGDGGKVGIDVENLGIFFEMMSRNIYSNPHGSIIRELSSNCFDSHIEAGVDRAVRVSRGYEDRDTYMYFEDFGVGISPERFKEIYLKYLSSTKRHTNEQIGGFGIGSKSPLSYTDIFFIRTRFEGTEYYYSISRGANSIPDWDMIYSKPTSSSNGTQVKFLIEGGVYSPDYNKFEKELHNQLKYFDNIYVEGFSFNNEYVVYDFDTFKFRTGISDTDMHIAIDKVSYPINWKVLGRPVIKIPVGVKFEIGELQVTANREEIRYNDDISAIINAKIDKTLAELEKLASKEFDDLESYLRWKKATVWMIDTTKCLIPIYEGDYGKYNNGKTIRYPFKKAKNYFKPLGDTSINIPDNPFFFLETRGFISDGSYTSITEDKTAHRYNRTEDDIWIRMRKYTPYRTKDFKPNIVKNKFIKNAIIIQKRKIKYKEFLLQLKLQEEVKSPFTQQIRRNPFVEGAPNKLKLIKHYIKVMTKEFVDKTQSYDTLQVPKDFIDEYNRLRNLNKPVKHNGEIAVLDFATDYRTKRIVNFKDLENKLVIYGANKDKDLLQAIYLMCSQRYKTNIMVIAINQNEFKLMEGNNKIDLETLISSKHKILLEQVTGFYIHEKYHRLRLGFTFPYVPAIKYHKERLDDFMQKCTRGNSMHNIMNSKFVKELIEAAKDLNLLIPEWIDLVDNLTLIEDDLEPLREVMENSKTSVKQKADIAKLLIIKGYSPERLLLFRPNEIETQWIREWKEYSKYTKEVNQAYERNPRRTYTGIHQLKPLKWQQENFQILEQNKSVKISMLKLERVML